MPLAVEGAERAGIGRGAVLGIVNAVLGAGGDARARSWPGRSRTRPARAPRTQAGIALGVAARLARARPPPCGRTRLDCRSPCRSMCSSRSSDWSAPSPGSRTATTPTARQALALAMTAGVVAAARAARGVDRVFIVTSEPGAASLGAATLDDGGLPWNEGLAHAIAALAPVPDAVAIVAGDLPLVTAADVEALVAAIPRARHRGRARARRRLERPRPAAARRARAELRRPRQRGAPRRARAGGGAGGASSSTGPASRTTSTRRPTPSGCARCCRPGPVRDLLDHRVPA